MRYSESTNQRQCFITATALNIEARHQLNFTSNLLFTFQLSNRELFIFTNTRIWERVVGVSLRTIFKCLFQWSIHSSIVLFFVVHDLFYNLELCDKEDFWGQYFRIFHFWIWHFWRSLKNIKFLNSLHVWSEWRLQFIFWSEWRCLHFWHFSQVWHVWTFLKRTFGIFLNLQFSSRL